jgi:GntR family transcriptional regulator/MocR family aminotransferase
MEAQQRRPVINRCHRRPGRFDRHLPRVREIYHARRDVLAAEAELAFGPGRSHGLAAGCHAPLRLPDGTSERAVVTTTATMGVRVNGLAHRRFAPQTPNQTRKPIRARPLSYSLGNVSELQIRRAIRTLAKAVRHQTTP